MKSSNIKLVLLFVSIALISSGCIGVNREFKNIRTQILDNLDDDFDRKMEFSVGPVGFFLASQFVKFADTEENIDQILSKVKNVHIGIYDRLSSFSKPSLSLLRSITNSIVKEDWKSLVKSIDGNELVGVYVKDQNLEDIEEIFIVTLTNDELVLVKLQGSLGSIIEIIVRNHGHEFRIAENS
ncbi:MAG: DUF4252 domain-containing protein [Ignavibacteriales bacterium]|nr:DUF4252 domain-containing protein [Ignavibacteriales bacterium]MCB9258408.1 DUF4252 domain-containing protein [Ignavibacteriales bacterium]